MLSRALCRWQCFGVTLRAQQSAARTRLPAARVHGWSFCACPATRLHGQPFHRQASLPLLQVYKRFWGWVEGDSRLIDLWPRLAYRRAPTPAELCLLLAALAPAALASG